MKIDNKRMNKGFSLFELLVSMSIIGILMAVAMVSYSSAQKKARDNRRMQDMNAIQKAAEQRYATNNYSYPDSSALMYWKTSTNEAILEVFPVDPKAPTLNYNYQKDVPTVGGYCACAQLENTTAGNSTSLNCTFAPNSGYYCVKNQQ